MPAAVTMTTAWDHPDGGGVAAIRAEEMSWLPAALGWSPSAASNAVGFRLPSPLNGADRSTQVGPALWAPGTTPRFVA